MELQAAEKKDRENSNIPSPNRKRERRIVYLKDEAETLSVNAACRIDCLGHCSCASK